MVAYDQLNQALEALAAQLEAKGKRRELVVIGGSGLIISRGSGSMPSPLGVRLSLDYPRGSIPDFTARTHDPSEAFRAELLRVLAYLGATDADI